MKSSALIVLLVLVACGKPTVSAVAPRTYEAAGDTAYFGHGPLDLDERGRIRTLELRQPGTVLLLRYSQSGRISQLSRRRLTAGLHVDPLPYTGSLSLRPGEGAWVVIVTAEDGYGTQPMIAGSSINERTTGTGMKLEYALSSLPAGLQRRGDSAWASYMVGY